MSVSEFENKSKISFYLLVESIFINNKEDDGLDIKLTPELKKIIYELLNIYPELFNELEKDIINIIKYENIKIEDISKFNEIIKHIFHTFFYIKDFKISTSNCVINSALFLKYIVCLIITNNRIQVDNEKKPILIKNIYSAIDSSLELITYSKSIKPKKFFKKMFG